MQPDGKFPGVLPGGLSSSNWFDIIRHMHAKNPFLTDWHQLAQMFCCVLMAGLLTGCVFSRTSVQMALAPRVDQPLREPVKASLEVAPVKDSRPVKDGSVLIHKSNQYGTTSGAYITEKPVAEIFADGLNAALRQNGFETTNATQYVLKSEIQSFDLKAIAGFWTGTLISKLSIRFELTSRATRLPVWHETYNGQDSAEAAWGTGQFVADAFSRAAEDVIRQLVSDQTFRNYFEP
jgi:Uncharacterized lipoprotein